MNGSRLEGKWGVDNFIPQELSAQLQSELGEKWKVENRGTRIEIVKLSHDPQKYGEQDDETIKLVAGKVLRGYCLKGTAEKLD